MGVGNSNMNKNIDNSNLNENNNIIKMKIVIEKIDV